LGRVAVAKHSLGNQTAQTGMTAQTVSQGPPNNPGGERSSCPFDLDYHAPNAAASIDSDSVPFDPFTPDAVAVGR